MIDPDDRASPYFQLAFYRLGHVLQELIDGGDARLDALREATLPPGRYCFISSDIVTVAPPSAATVPVCVEEDDDFPARLLGLARLAGAA